VYSHERRRSVGLQVLRIIHFKLTR
jgi:hypothetical protein